MNSILTRRIMYPDENLYERTSLLLVNNGEIKLMRILRAITLDKHKHK